MKPKILLSEKKVTAILKRLCHQLIERHGDFSNSILIGMQPRGVLLLDQIIRLLKEEDIREIKYGKLDVTFFRDDFRGKEKPLKLSMTKPQVNKCHARQNRILLHNSIQLELDAS